MNKNSILFTIAAAGLILNSAACAPVAVGAAAGTGVYVAKDKRSVGNIVDDASITTAIKAKFLKDDLVSTVQIHVDTTYQVVTLTGNVPSYEALQRAIKLAEETNGVRRVISKLTIGHSQHSDTAGHAIDDASITTAIKAKYLTDDLVSTVDIHVETNNGIVTLAGHVKNHESLRRAISIAEHTRGVKRVNSKITVISR